jgi:hypothetical protein
VLSCALLHGAFIAFFYGAAFSWTYYSYVLVMGIAAAAVSAALPRVAVWALAAIALVANKAALSNDYRAWTAAAATSETAGLWASADERGEWTRVRATAHGCRTAMLIPEGAAEVLFPEFEKPVSLYLTEGLYRLADIARKTAQIAAAQLVVMPGPSSRYGEFLPPAPIRQAMANFELIWRGKYFAVYRSRTAPAACAPTSAAE